MKLCAAAVPGLQFFGEYCDPPNEWFTSQSLPLSNDLPVFVVCLSVGPSVRPACVLAAAVAAVVVLIAPRSSTAPLRCQRVWGRAAVIMRPYACSLWTGITPTLVGVFICIQYMDILISTATCLNNSSSALVISSCVILFFLPSFSFISCIPKGWLYCIRRCLCVELSGSTAENSLESNITILISKLIQT